MFAKLVGFTRKMGAGLNAGFGMLRSTGVFRPTRVRASMSLSGSARRRNCIVLDTDMTSSRSIRQLLNEMTMIAEENAASTVIDCAQVVKVDSGAVAALVEIARRHKATGARAELKNVGGKLARMLELYRLIPVLQKAGMSVYLI